MNSFLSPILISVSFILFSNNIFSQTIVHIENKRLGEEVSGYSGKIELSANFIQNVNDIFQSVNNFQSNYYKNKNNFLVSSSFNLTIFNKARVVNEGFVHLRYGRKLSKLITLETFVQGQYNEIIKIRSRYLTGSGPRFRILSKDSVKLYIGTLLMPELETETSGKINRHMRLSNYVSFGFPVRNKMTIDFIGYFQPDLSYFKDFRLSGQAILEMKISNRISFLFAHSLFYDAYPPEGIRNLFYNFRNGLTFEF